MARIGPDPAAQGRFYALRKMGRRGRRDDDRYGARA